MANRRFGGDPMEGSMAELHVHYNDGRVNVVTLDRPDFTLGRDPACEFALDDALTSRRHARIRSDDKGQLWIDDLSSKNGTTLNDQPVLSARLGEGDRIG